MGDVAQKAQGSVAPDEPVLEEYSKLYQIIVCHVSCIQRRADLKCIHHKRTDRNNVKGGCVHQLGFIVAVPQHLFRPNHHSAHPSICNFHLSDLKQNWKKKIKSTTKRGKTERNRSHEVRELTCKHGSPRPPLTPFCTWYTHIPHSMATLSFLPISQTKTGHLT